MQPSWRPRRRAPDPTSSLQKSGGRLQTRSSFFFWCYFTLVHMLKVFVKCFTILWEGTWCATARKCCYYVATKHSVLQTAHPGISFSFTKAFCNTPAILSSCSFQKTGWSLEKIKYRQDFQGCLNGLVAQILLKGHNPQSYVLCCLCSVFRVL